jgi:hypothetical protein
LSLYPPLHTPPAPRADQTRAQYGAALFAWYLSPHGNTATMSDEAIELAEYAGRTASTAREMLPAYYARVTEARHELIATIARRRAELAADAPQVPATSPQAPTIGPMAPVPVHPPTPAPPAPVRLPIMPAPVRPGDSIRF